jgi:transposase
MRKPIFARELLPAELEALHQGLRSSDAFTMRRCQILLASAKGRNALEIARNLHCTDQTVRNAIHDFDTEGLSALVAGSSRPHNIERAFDGDQLESLREMLHQSPRKYGKDTSLWTLELAAEVAHEQRLSVTRVTGETVRATLERMGMGWRRAKRWITSPDPEYLRKKRGGIG